MSALRSLAVVVVLLNAVSPAGAAKVHTVLYGNAQYVAEGGDDVGMELRLHQSAKPWIDFVLCEGVCFDPVRLPVVMSRTGFTFTYRQATVKGGRPGPDLVTPFVATYRGKNLIVRSPGPYPDILRPLRKPLVLP